MLPFSQGTFHSGPTSGMWLGWKKPQGRHQVLILLFIMVLCDPRAVYLTSLGFICLTWKKGHSPCFSEENGDLGKGPGTQ